MAGVRVGRSEGGRMGDHCGWSRAHSSCRDGALRRKWAAAGGGRGRTTGRVCARVGRRSGRCAHTSLASVGGGRRPWEHGLPRQVDPIYVNGITSLLPPAIPALPDQPVEALCAEGCSAASIAYLAKARGPLICRYIEDLVEGGGEGRGVRETSWDGGPHRAAPSAVRELRRSKALVSHVASHRCSPCVCVCV